MAGKKINYYDIYKDNQLLMKCVTSSVASKMTGVRSADISNYASSKLKIRSHGNIYYFVLVKSEETIPKIHIVRTVKLLDTAMPQTWQDEWNYWRKIVNPGAIE